MKSTPCTEALSDHLPKYSFNLAPRCGAKTRSGSPCKSPVVRNRNRCRMHGGAKRSGAPIGNQNAFKHGFTSNEVIQDRRFVKNLIIESRAFISKVTK